MPMSLFLCLPLGSQPPPTRSEPFPLSNLRHSPYTSLSSTGSTRRLSSLFKLTLIFSNCFIELRRSAQRHAVCGLGHASGFHGICRAEAAPALRIRMDAGGIATGSYRSPDGNQHHRRLGPLSYPQGRMGSDAMRYRRQQRTPHNIQRCQPVGVQPPRPFREFPLQGPGVLTRDIRTPTSVPPCQETDFLLRLPRTMSPQSSTHHPLRCLRLGSVPDLLRLPQSWTSAVLIDCLCPNRQIQRWSHPQSPTAYLSPSRQATSTFFPPTDDGVQSTSSSTSHPPRADSADLKVFCALPSGTIAAMAQAPKRLMWDSGANRSGTGSKAGLRNITACPPLSIQGAFGPPIQPTHRENSVL
jgi:hypothetical protein